MDTVHKANDALVAVEGKLRELIEQGLREQRYDEVAEVAKLAQGVSRLLQGRSGQSAPAGDSTISQPAPGASAAVIKTRVKATKADFPHFERDGDKLVKIGWSKKNRSSYEHRAPKESVLAFVRHLLGSTEDRKAFAVEDLLPVPDIVNGGELPAYQVYLALAWLRHSGAIEKKGRDGYVLRSRGLDNDGFDRLWANLPVRFA